MKTLLLGYSSLSRRRVLPALARLGVGQVDIASESRVDDIVLPKGTRGRRFNDYLVALEQSNADLVYVSTVNSLHAPLAERALSRGFHVVVDKPAFLSVEESEHLVAIARSRRRCLAEATVYTDHPSYDAIRRIFEAEKAAPTRLAATFSFPPLPGDNYRYVAALGGGALLDLGPYAVTPGRHFFHAEPDSVTCHIVDRTPEVETAFSVLLTYPGGRSMVGHYGMGTGYMNRLDILGPGLTVSIERAFSPPPDAPIVLHVRGNSQTFVEVGAEDSFVTFLRRVHRAIALGEHGDFAETLLADARLLGRLRRVAAATGARQPPNQ